MSRINEKLGLKVTTRVRAATHGPAIASSQRCPECGGRHVLATQSANGKRMGAFMCARCGAFF